MTKAKKVQAQKILNSVHMHMAYASTNLEHAHKVAVFSIGLRTCLDKYAKGELTEEQLLAIIADGVSVLALRDVRILTTLVPCKGSTEFVAHVAIAGVPEEKPRVKKTKK